jgi:ferric-chelate reductase [NAD(P)H]
MIDSTSPGAYSHWSALNKFNYGLYIVSSIAGERINGQLANTVFQVTAEPIRIAASINKGNLTHQYIMESGLFSISVVAESATMIFIGLFGFRSGRDIDKFSKVTFKKGPAGCPIVTEHVVSAVEARVIDRIDIGTHTLFIGEVIHTEILSEEKPMSYAYYQENLRGKTPQASPTYKPPIENK